ncbi:Mitochondrial substrate carrier family protein Q [Neolecta irregularis DAH-3]|uniref:Mitochondrial substrate carrier family protein Q n=1 Tax=Neolecta irregularis (strain DAH-3) TaxID=1198029 RepID=A0A1U7LQ71_NEOID|nr:Mitochondrial substrate carrier family protein Q [Neolecta irregularis DAH-3]|eukprot:OLL24779.1 Mitochondrial substrate carrier family protein Q [Neolecta irregularis DAH-3]
MDRSVRNPRAVPVSPRISLSAASMAAPPLPAYADALAGTLGAVFANAIVYPLDILKTRMQVDRSGKKESTLHGLRRILAEEGPAGLYAGMLGGLLGVASTNYTYFFYSDLLHSYWPPTTTLVELAWGAVAGAAAQICTLPVSVCTTRQQTTIPAPSLPSVVKEIIHEDGISGLWSGLKPSLVLVANPAITYGLFERLKDGRKLTPLQAFILGAFCKSIATVVTYPYIMAKVRLQHKPSLPVLTTSPESHTKAQKHASEKYYSAIDVLSKVYRHHGISGWYKGLEAQLSKAVLSQAILFYFREVFRQWTWVLLLILKRKM